MRKFTCFVRLLLLVVVLPSVLMFLLPIEATYHIQHFMVLLPLLLLKLALCVYITGAGYLLKQCYGLPLKDWIIRPLTWPLGLAAFIIEVRLSIKFTAYAGLFVRYASETLTKADNELLESILRV